MKRMINDAEQLENVVYESKTNPNKVLGTDENGNIVYKEISGGLKLWQHTFTKGNQEYAFIMFTNKKSSQLQNDHPYFPLYSFGPSVINSNYFTGTLFVSGSSINVSYLKITDGQLSTGNLNLSGFTETITEFVE